MRKNNSQNFIDNYIQDNATDAVPVPEDQEAIVAEANAIYERLLREAAEDEADDGPDLDYDDEETLAFNRENGIFEISMDELDATDGGAEEAAAASEASAEGAEPTDSEKE